jgi:hypothetical protein
MRGNVMTLPRVSKEQIQALVDAAWQCLDDMSISGHSVCGLAKAQLRVAYEPFASDEDKQYGDWMTYESAKKMVEGAT